MTLPRILFRVLRGIYPIVDTALTADPLALIEDVLAAGVGIVQLRAKSGAAPDLVQAIHARTMAAGALFIINDEPALLPYADGIHLGPEDLEQVDLAALRARFPQAVIGISCATPDEVRVAEAAGASYAGVGAMFATAHKADAGSPIGADGVKAVVDAAHIPVAAIGGITRERLADVAGTGAAMAAVIGEITLAPEPRERTRELVATWNTLRL